MDFVTVCSSHVANYRSELNDFITICTMDYVTAITVVTLCSPGECCWGQCFLGTAACILRVIDTLFYPEGDGEAAVSFKNTGASLSYPRNL
jgi:hypothetical protein